MQVLFDEYQNKDNIYSELQYEQRLEEKEEKVSTRPETNINYSVGKPGDEEQKDIQEKELCKVSRDITKKIHNEKIIPEQYKPSKIKDILLDLNVLTTECANKFEESERVRTIDENMSDEKYYNKKGGKERKKDKDIEDENGKKNDLLEKKTKEKKEIKKHGPDSEDNIMRTINTFFYSFLVISSNELIYSTLGEKIYNLYNQKNYRARKKKDLIKEIAYSTKSTLKKQIIIDNLNKKVEDLIKMDINTKYKSKEPQYNKHIIDLISKEHPNEVIEKFLNLKFRDWIDFITYKNTDVYNNEKWAQILNNFRISKLLEKFPKNDETKFFMFIYLIFNYERWFLIKEGRKRKIKKQIIFIANPDVHNNKINSKIKNFEEKSKDLDIKWDNNLYFPNFWIKNPIKEVSSLFKPLPNVCIPRKSNILKKQKEIKLII